MANKKLVYICAPYRGDIRGNFERARRYSKAAIDVGHLPIAPHLLLDGMYDDNAPEEREKVLELGLELLNRCDEVWVFGKHISEGMKGEIEAAKNKRMPIRLMTGEKDGEELKHRLKQLRKDNFLTLRELASMLNKTKSAVSRWEVGKSKPDTDTLVALSKVFRCSVDYLLGVSPFTDKGGVMHCLEIISETLNTSYPKKYTKKPYIS